ncbi:hypothetical protein ACJMK2_041537 [Sinanodonta woodiana]|uniref:Peptidase A1 domain-containing protein n=1 Tax=Sinanodonta woodiana TaxID=1069815 RepID=A0ABD3W4H5_SINWO
MKNRQIGIYVNRLVFYEGGDSTTTPNVISIDGGCKQTVTAYGLTTNFVKNVNSVLPVNGGVAAGGTDGVYASDSGTFQPALWLKSTGISTSLKIEADIVQCLLADQSKCDDPQTSLCSSGKRQRRAAEDTGLQNLTALGTRFTISLLAGSTDQISGMKDDKRTMETCYQTYTFWIVLLVFGILMLLCLIFAVYLYFRLRREKESRRRTEEKYGVINPATNEIEEFFHLFAHSRIAYRHGNKNLTLLCILSLSLNFHFALKGLQILTHFSYLV